MAYDHDTHDALLADALRLAEDGSLSASADALRSALEVDFRPEVAAVLSRLELAMETGEGVTGAIEELREVVDDGGFFGSDVVVEDPPTQRSTPLSTDTVRRRPGSRSETPVNTDLVKEPTTARSPAADPFETAPRKPADDDALDLLRTRREREETSRPSPAPSVLDMFEDVDDVDDVGGSPGPGARYRGTAPPPPSHRRRAIPAASSDRPDTLAESNEFEFFSDVEAAQTTQESGPHDLDTAELDGGGFDGAEFDGATPSTRRESETVPTPAAGRVSRRPRRVPGDGDTPQSGQPLASSRKTGRLQPVDDGKRRLPVSMLVDRAKALMARGDLASASEIIDEALRAEPGQGEAMRLRDDLNHRLSVLRMDALEPLDRVPVAVMDAVGDAAQNPRAMYLLTLVDGTLTLQDLIDLSGVPALEAATLISDLIERGALRLG